MWKEKIIDLGEIVAGKDANYEIIFEWMGEGEMPVREIKSSCTCSKSEVSYDDKSIKVEYKPKEFPIHLRRDGRNFFFTQKTITVTYKDNTIDVLSFKAKVYDEKRFDENLKLKDDTNT